MAFDYAGAKQAGFSDEQIAASLARTANFDLDGALKAGHAYTEILPSLLARANTTAPNAEESLQQRIAAIKPDYTLGESLTKGVSRGITQLGSTFGDVVPAMVGSALGFDDYAKKQMEEAAQTQQEIAATNAPEFQSYKDVHGLYDTAKFAAQVTGEQLPNLAVSLVPGVGAEMLAGRGALALAGEAATAGLGEQAAALAAKAAAQKQTAGYIGTYLGSYAQNAPEVFQNIYQDSGKLAPAAAALFGTASAALDSFLPASLMKNLTGPLKVGIVEKILERSGMDKGLLRSVTSNVIKDTIGEGVTEGMQEGISEAAERFMNDHPEAFGQKDWDRIMESAVQGGLGGGVLGGVGGGMERYREGAQDRQRLADIREQRAARDAATQRRQNLGGQLELGGVEQPPAGAPLPTPPTLEPVDNFVGPLPEPERVLDRATQANKKQAEMFTDQGTLTPAAEAMEKRDTRAIAATDKAAAIRARQAAQQQAAADKAATQQQAAADKTAAIQARQAAQQQAAAAKVEARKAKNIQKPSSQQGLDLGEPVDLARNIRAEDVPPAANGQLDIFAGEGVKPAAPVQTALPSVLPTDQKALYALFPGASSELSIFKEHGPLWGRDLSDPVALKQVKDELSGYGYRGKNATAVEEFLKRPEFQTTPTEDTSGQTETVKAKTQKRPVGQKTSTGVDNTPATNAAAATGRTIAAEELTALGVTKNALNTPNIKTAMNSTFPAEQRATALEAHANNEIVAKKPNVQQNLRTLANELRGVSAQGGVSEQTKPVVEPVVKSKLNPKPRADKPKVAVTHETFFPEGRSEAEGINALVDAYTKNPKDPAINRVRIDAATRLSAPASKTLATAIREVNKVIKPLFGPKYQGKSFDEATKALVRQGSIGAVLTKVASSANPEIARVLNKIKVLGLKTKIVIGEVQSGPGLLMSQKPQKYKATGGEAAYIAAADGGKWINFQGLNTLDSVRQAAEQDFKTQANSKPVFKDARPYVNGVLNNPAMRGNQQLEALRAQYGDNPARLASDLEGRLVQDHTQAIRAAASLLFAEHKDSPMFMSLVMRMVLADQGATQVATPMPLLRDALADLRTQWETGNIRGVKAARTAYDAAAVLHAEAALKLNPNNIKGLEGGEWVELPQGKTPEVFAFWRSMSNANWCTSRGQEQYYAPRGSMYVYRKDGASRMAILFQNGEVDQIQSEDNDGTIPAEYLAEVKNFTAKAKLSSTAKRTLEHAEKATLLLSKLMALAAPGATFDENGFIELLDGTFGVRGDYEFDVNESLNDAEYLARQKANGSFGRTVSYVLGNAILHEGAQANALTTVGGNLNLYADAQANALTTVGGRVTLHEGAQAKALTTVSGNASLYADAQANALTTVGGSAILAEGAQANALTTVDGSAILLEGAQAKALTTVGGYIDLSAGAQVNALTTVGGNVDLYVNAQANALTTVGGYLNLYEGAQANTLTTVNGNVILSADAQANALTTVGGYLNLYAGAQANALTTVGEGATLHEGAQANALTTVGGDLNLSEDAQANALTTVGGGLNLQEGAQANALTTVGGYLNLYAYAQANALTTVGGDIDLSAGAKAKALTTVGGMALLRKGAQANALTTVGRYLNLHEGAQANALTTVGEIAILYADAQAKALTTVGGRATLHPSVIRPPGLRTEVGRREALRGTPLGVLNSSDFSGSYNSVTDTITLHPETGLNEHIFLHEVSHAALAHAIANPNLLITKQFAEFFNQIKDQMGDAYGGQDLQEFAAELVSNPEFQALLKTIKAPRSGSLWDRIMQAIAEFFGFRKGQSSYEVGLKFVSDLLDVSGDQKANPAEELFYGNGNVNNNSILTSMIGDPGVTKDKLLNGLSSIKEFNSKVGALALVSLNNLDTMFGKGTKYNLPIRMLEKWLERKRTELDKYVDASGKKMGEINKVAAKYPEQIKRMSQMARDARRAGVDLLDPKFKPTASNQAEYTRLQNVHNTLHPDVRKVYATIRTDLDGHLAKFRDLVKSFLSPSAAQKLDAAFANLAGVTGYVPFMRYGDFWIEYADPVTGERTPRAFDSPRERVQEIARLEAAYPKLKGQIEQKRNLQDIRAPKDLPAASFVGQIIAGMRANSASEDTVNSVYQQYISMFPASSIMKQFNKAKLLPGESEDIIRAYSDVNMRWAQKLVNTEFNPQILQAYNAVQSAADKFGGDTTIDAVKQSLANNRDSFLNLHYSGITNALAQSSYILNIAGSVASAMVNLSGLITSVHPVLGGRFGFDSAAASMVRAGKTAVGDWSKNPKYAQLHKELGHLLKETVSREAWDREGGVGDNAFTTNLRKVINLISIPFNASERYMRGVTAIAAYDLALKGNASTSQKAMSPAEAIEFAGKTIKDLHTAGMAEVAPGVFKSDFGKVALTFKSIPFQQAFVIARAFHQAVMASDASPEVKQVARRQLLGIFGTSGALLGAAGLPFFGAYTVLARILNFFFGDDDEPYDPTQQAISAAGSVFGNGLIANVFNISASQRMALASDILWRDDPKSVQDNGYMKTAMFDLMGPMGSYFVNAERGIDEILKGQIERGFETLAPIAMRNAMKGARYWMDGATTLKGDPIESDINAYSALMQMTGFSPADLAEIQRITGAEKTAEKAILTRKQRILDKYDAARRVGDYSLMQEAQQEAAAFRQKYPKIMKGDTLQRSYKSFEQAKKENVHGVRISKGLKQQLGEEFPIEN